MTRMTIKKCFQKKLCKKNALNRPLYLEKPQNPTACPSKGLDRPYRIAFCCSFSPIVADEDYRILRYFQVHTYLVS